MRLISQWYSYTCTQCPAIYTLFHSWALGIPDVLEPREERGERESKDAGQQAVDMAGIHIGYLHTECSNLGEKCRITLVGQYVCCD